MDYRELMNGAGLGDVLIPKKEFIKEHERLVALLNQSDIPALRKEAKEQKAELEAELSKKGGSNASNFIARMMAEAKFKHASPEEKQKGYNPSLGKYVKHSVMDPDNDDTEMNQAIKFDYNKLASASQSKSSQNKQGNPYGASPFIAYHFGHAQTKPRESAVQKAARNKFRKRPAPSAVEEKEEKKDSFEKRVASREAYQKKKSENPFENVILPESQKRKERRERQAAAKRREAERKRAEMSPSEAERDKEREKAERAKQNRERKKAQYERSIVNEPKGFLSAADKEPQSRPPQYTKSEWLNYLKSDRYQQLLEQRAFEARQAAQQIAQQRARRG